MLRGLPASGKSSFAKHEATKPLTTRVNKDDIRRSLDRPWSRRLEQEVLQIRDSLIKRAFIDGGPNYTVIVDDTNFAKKHENRLRQLASQFGAEFEIKEFNTPLETCIERDSKREGLEKVGEGVIRTMYEQFIGAKAEPKTIEVVPYVNDPSLRGAVICDLDGTLAIHNGRSPYDFQRCDTDLVNKPIRDLLWVLFSAGTAIIYLSGRDDIVADKTQAWLDKNKCPVGPLYMRVTGDKRGDAIVKRELLDAHVAGKLHVEFVLDDRDRVVKMWRDLGLTCLQVNYGNF